MKIAILMCLFAASSAWADAPPETVQAETALPVCQLDPQDSTKLLVEPCRPAPPVGARRAVPQVIGRMPATQMPPPVIQYQAAPPAPSTVPSAPRPIGACDAGGCRDAAGARYNTGVGNQTLDANGRICHRNGAFIQCF
ncbi:hypothetical protein [Janthinobacterium aquaticum]|uniref:hypothetical protein n=1 Tax=Janthinobacterium sp. FT58W TaxID=2654254 RepID=UPI001264D658|nr:hypothetical protein [Janthinobacterium sp. FT58W]KAB8041436.1 hypothetical protein GCM43_18615 [Janthinobacterium sp. FT58W]